MVSILTFFNQYFKRIRYPERIHKVTKFTCFKLQSKDLRHKLFVDKFLFFKLKVGF